MVRANRTPTSVKARENSEMIEAIRRVCVDCAGSGLAVKECRHGMGVTRCVLFPWRMGPGYVRRSRLAVESFNRVIKRAINTTCRQCRGTWSKGCPDESCGLNVVVWKGKKKDVK